MCGIAGWVGGKLDPGRVEAVARATRALAHRGPDDEGSLVRETDRGAVVVGHRRLAIIDRSSAGHQPMFSADGRYAIVLNGEIYNFVELREELERSGHRFRSRSDTEVLLAAFTEWGARCLPRLIGMFAFAVVDFATGTLFLARDPFGQKPLYYAPSGDGFAFASELKPLLDLAAVPRRVDPQRLIDYLDHGSTDHGGGTIVAGVQLLPPAHHVTIAFGGPFDVVPARYWAPDLEAELDISFPEAASRLRELFLESVRLHLRSDVRVGTLLSGGLDSSSVVVAMRELGGPALDLHTLSYIPDAGTISEEPWIDEVNRAAGAIAHKVRLVQAEWVRDFERLVLAQEAPFGSIAIYAQYRLFAEARAAGIGVVLGGQGSDELIGGYRSLWPDRIVASLRRGHWFDALAFLRRAGRLRYPGDPGARRLARAALARLGPVKALR